MSPNSVKRRKNTHLQGEKRVSDDHAAPNFVNTFVQHINTLLRRSPPGNTSGLQAKAKEEGVTDLFFAVLSTRGELMPKKKSTPRTRPQLYYEVCREDAVLRRMDASHANRAKQQTKLDLAQSALADAAADKEGATIKEPELEKVGAAAAGGAAAVGAFSNIAARFPLPGFLCPGFRSLLAAFWPPFAVISTPVWASVPGRFGGLF